MVKNIKIREIHTDSLSCEPLVKRAPNGDLVCVCQCGGTTEPAPENRVYVFRSSDDGETWSEKYLLHPEDGQAVYATELSIDEDGTLTAYLTVHSGRFLDWKCIMYKSSDSGFTWKNAGLSPHFPEYTFMRAPINTREEHDRIMAYEGDRAIFRETRTPYCESGVIESCDGGQTWLRHTACRFSQENGWVWSEPTIAELSDGSVAMLLRWCRTGWLYRCDSADGGRTWGDYYKTDIPNPSNKPRLILLPDGRIALIHTPNNKDNMKNGKWAKRWPLELWISDDDMKTWGEKVVLTDFPGAYSYSDGFYEDGHIRFVIEHNRHTILHFDVEL